MKELDRSTRRAARVCAGPLQSATFVLPRSRPSRRSACLRGQPHEQRAVVHTKMNSENEQRVSGSAEHTESDHHRPRRDPSPSGSRRSPPPPDPPLSHPRLTDFPHGQISLLAVIDHHPRPDGTELRPLRIWFVVNSRVNDARVSCRLVRGQRALLVEHADPAVRVAQGQLARARQPHDAAAHHRQVEGCGGGGGGGGAAGRGNSDRMRIASVHMCAQRRPAAGDCGLGAHRGCGWSISAGGVDDSRGHGQMRVDESCGWRIACLCGVSDSGVGCRCEARGMRWARSAGLGWAAGQVSALVIRSDACGEG